MSEKIIPPASHNSDISALDPSATGSIEFAHQQRIIETLYRVTNFMSEVTDLQRLLTLIMQESENVMDSEASACMLYDKESDELFFEVALGEKGDEIKSIRLNRGQGFAGICLAEGRTMVINDVAQDKRHDKRADNKSQFVTRNLVATPMRFRGKMIGVLEVLNKRGNACYTDEDAGVLEVLAEQAAMAITNARLVEESIKAERLAAIGLAVSGIAHHLKNIIQGIKAPLGLIRMAFDMENMGLVERALPIIERSSTRMEQSVGEMLNYSKVREPELEEGHINVLVKDIGDESRERASEQGVELRLDLDESIPISGIDSLRLHDAILNLLGNALEAQGEGAEGAFVCIRTALVSDGKEYRVEVEDNGPGIPPDALKKIFEPFYSTKGSKGTGLGLAVARKVARENGGTLTATSEPGIGTTFTFQLPIVPPMVGAQEPK